MINVLALSRFRFNPRPIGSQFFWASWKKVTFNCFASVLAILKIRNTNRKGKNVHLTRSGCVNWCFSNWLFCCSLFDWPIARIISIYAEHTHRYSARVTARSVTIRWIFRWPRHVDEAIRIKSNVIDRCVRVGHIFYRFKIVGM